MKYIPELEKEVMCSIGHGLDISGERRKSGILYVLSFAEVTRYNGIRKEPRNVTDMVLAAMPKELTADDLINHTQYNEIPPRVEYSLTQKGKSVLPIPQSIHQWFGIHAAISLNERLPPCRTCSQLPSQTKKPMSDL